LVKISGAGAKPTVFCPLSVVNCLITTLVLTLFLSSSIDMPEQFALSHDLPRHHSSRLGLDVLPICVD
jgi:hypothetical protein